MTLIPSLTTWNDGDELHASALNGNFASIRDTLNTSGAFTDVVRTWTAAQTFNAGITATTVSATTISATTVSAAERFKFSANESDFEAGSIYRSPLFGVVVAGHAGSVYDMALVSAGAEAALAVKEGADGETNILLFDVTAAQVVRVSRGAADSGGAGFRALRIPN